MVNVLSPFNSSCCHQQHQHFVQQHQYHQLKYHHSIQWIDQDTVPLFLASRPTWNWPIFAFIDHLPNNLEFYIWGVLPYQLARLQARSKISFTENMYQMYSNVYDIHWSGLIALFWHKIKSRQLERDSARLDIMEHTSVNGILCWNKISITLSHAFPIYRNS